MIKGAPDQSMLNDVQQQVELDSTANKQQVLVHLLLKLGKAKQAASAFEILASHKRRVRYLREALFAALAENPKSLPEFIEQAPLREFSGAQLETISQELSREVARESEHLSKQQVAAITNAAEQLKTPERRTSEPELVSANSSPAVAVTETSEPASETPNSRKRNLEDERERRRQIWEDYGHRLNTRNVEWQATFAQLCPRTHESLTAIASAGDLKNKPSRTLLELKDLGWTRSRESASEQRVQWSIESFWTFRIWQAVTSKHVKSNYHDVIPEFRRRVNELLIDLSKLNTEPSLYYTMEIADLIQAILPPGRDYKQLTTAAERLKELAQQILDLSETFDLARLRDLNAKAVRTHQRLRDIEGKFIQPMRASLDELLLTWELVLRDTGNNGARPARASGSGRLIPRGASRLVRR